MAIRLDLMRPRAFVAPRVVRPKQTVIKTRDISRKTRFSIEASQILSENLRSSIVASGGAQPSWLWGRRGILPAERSLGNQARAPGCLTGKMPVLQAYFSFRNSICSPKSSGLRAFFVKSAATVAESFVSLEITLSLTFRRLRCFPSSESFQTT